MDGGRDNPEGIHIQPIAERSINRDKGPPAGEEGIELEELSHKAGHCQLGITPPSLTKFRRMLWNSAIAITNSSMLFTVFAFMLL